MRELDAEERAEAAQISFDLLKRAESWVRGDRRGNEKRELVTHALRVLNGRKDQLAILLSWISVSWLPLMRNLGTEPDSVRLRIVDEDGRDLDPESPQVPTALVCFGRLQVSVFRKDNRMAEALWNVAVQQGYAAELIGVALIHSAETLVRLENASP